MIYLLAIAKLYRNNNLFYNLYNFHLCYQDKIFVSSVFICSSVNIYITYNNEKKCKNKLDLISLRNMTIYGIAGMIFGTLFAETFYMSFPVAVISGGIMLLDYTFLK